MLGTSHCLSGILAATIAAQVVGAGSGVELLGSMAVGALLVTGASLLPDIDCGSATVSNTFGPLTQGLSLLIRRVTGGHRRGTHSLAGAAILAGVTYVAVQNRDSIWAIVILSMVFTLALAGPLRLLHIEGWLDDVLPIPVAITMAMWDVIPLDMAPAALFLGVLVHVLGDMITRQGCPVFWPLSDEKVRIARLRAGGPTERYLLRPGFIAAIPVAACWTWINPYWVAMWAG